MNNQWDLTFFCSLVSDAFFVLLDLLLTINRGLFAVTFGHESSLPNDALAMR